MRILLVACIIGLSLTASGCSAGIQSAMQKTTNTIQPIINQTRALCQVARACARQGSATDEAVVVRLCEDIWRGWRDLETVQRMIIEAADGE